MIRYTMWFCHVIIVISSEARNLVGMDSILG